MTLLTRTGTVAGSPIRNRLLWRAMGRDAPVMVSLAGLLVLVLVALVAPLFMSDLVTRQDLTNPLAPPRLSDGVWGLLGTDSLGRSLLARLIVAARTTLLIAVCAVGLSALVGTLLGATVGYFGGWAEALFMRIADVIMSFPSLLLALVILYVFGPRATLIVVVLAITRLPVYLRTARARTRELRGLPYIEAARGLGLSPWRILVRHGIPAVVPTILVLVTVELGLVMLIESSLTFLGIGVQPPEVSWGLLAAGGRSYLSTAWWLSFFPGLAICLTVVAINIVSNWLRLAADPKQRWRFLSDTEPLTSVGGR